jgi:hypothetical protein
MADWEISSLAIVYDTFQREAPQRLALLHADTPGRVLAWRDGRSVSAAQFLAHVRQAAATPPAPR